MSELNNVMLGTWGLAGENKVSNMSLGWPKIDNEIISYIFEIDLRIPFAEFITSLKGSCMLFCL